VNNVAKCWDGIEDNFNTSKAVELCSKKGATLIVLQS